MSTQAIKRIGVLTGGGDAPGLNPALKAIVYKATVVGIEVIGLHDGWHGLLNEGCQEWMRLEDHTVRRWDRDRRDESWLVPDESIPHPPAEPD